ncbi:MAG: zinc transporter ZntB [Rickettsiales bacterium]|nr:zinc transporter ZntB [Rickettsiales bacterium]
MQSEHPILFSLILDNQGSADESDPLAVIDALRDDRLAWVHMNADHEDTAAWLRDNISYLNPLIINALLAEETRPRCEAFDDGLLLILRGVNLNEGAEPDDMVSLRLWVDENRIISLCKRNLRAVEMLKADLMEGHGPHNSADLVSSMIHALLEVMEPVFSEMDDATDRIEAELVDKPDMKLRFLITDIRSSSIQLRRYIAPQRDAITRLRSLQLGWLDEPAKHKLLESQDRITRYVEQLDAIRERCQVVQDELTNTLADKLNRNMYTLSVIAGIFLPLGFLTGLLGINVGGMPGVDDADAFTIVAIACVIIAFIELLIFRKLRWI